MSACIRCVVSGRVQGVWFRGFTRQAAQRLGVTGYAKNLPDGRVEVLACGSPDALGRLRELLAGGPPAAQVTGVECHPVADSAPVGFVTM